VTDQPSADLISLPEGGGAISGIGETFQPDLHTGTGNLTIPFELPAGRNGLQPSLALSYSTGNPNGPFGLGWALPVPGVRRKTDKGIPRYDPALDTFVLSGAEDLIPVSGVGTGAVRYRPCSEASYARITHVTGASGDYWEVWSTGGLRSRYGTPRPPTPPAGWADPAVIADPDLPERIFAWLLTETIDSLGNRISYSYRPDSAGTAQRYLSEISYADYGDLASPDYLVAVKIVPDSNQRPDPFSDHRPGFELRTTQRVAAIETWTQAGVPVLARRVELAYADQVGTAPANSVSLLTRITVTGVDGGSRQALPPLEFGYTSWDPAARRYQELTAPAAQLPSSSPAGPGVDLVDVFGDGLASILQLNGAARYWRNRGDGTFDPPRSLAYAPAGVTLGDSGVQLADFDGDGRPDLLVSTPDRTGYWPLASNGGFDPAGYVRVSPAPTLSLSDPLVRLIDLDGDGITDALRTGDRFELFYSDRGASFSRVQVIQRGGQVPDVTFGDPRVFLADMTGDGLTDLVLVHDGNISYWPYQGYGSWGAKVVMRNPPRLSDSAADPGTRFDPRRLLLGDVDGDGCADAVYVGDGTVTVWVNQAGNGFADPVIIRGTPRVAGASLRLADMGGTGTAGVLWTYDLGSVRGSSYKFLDLTGGTKPYVLDRIDNHAGAATTISYAPSTAYATADRAAGHPWQTTLPFPVQVVARTTVTDYFSQTTLTSEYVYHHGYWDGADREFRGFARVDQRDTLTPTGQAASYYSPPTETRTWFHLGPVGPEQGGWTEGLDLSREYWPGDAPLTVHVDTSALPQNMNRRGRRHAIRALKGRALRSELYALDGGPGADRPYQISDRAYALAPISDGREASDWETSPVVAVHQVLDRTSVWERGTEPMTKATATGGYDDYGRPHRRVDIAVPRGRDPRITSPAGTSPYLASMTLTEYATRDDGTHYLINRVSLQQRLELTEDTARAGADLNTYTRQQLAAPPTPTADNIRALTLTYYDGPAFSGLPNGQLGDWGLRTRVENLTLTPSILAAAYQGGGPAIPPPPYLQPGAPAWTADYPQAFQDLTAPLAGYRYQADQAPCLAGWYTQQERVTYDVQQGSGRGLVTAWRDPLGNDTTVAYDTYQLLPATVSDPVGLAISAAYDYRILRPSVITDRNGNQAAVGYTPLGLPAWTASTGKPGANQGDTVGQPGTVFSYDLTAWDDNPGNRQPISVHTIRRVDHPWTLINAEAQKLGRPLTPPEIAILFPADETIRHPDRLIQKTEFTDGFGRMLQTRSQGDDTVLDDLGLTADMNAKPGPVVTHQQDHAAPPQVVVSGWQTYDNKGRIVEKYEPFFDTGWAYQPPVAAQLSGLLAKVVAIYDPRGLAIRTIFPDGSEQRLIPGVPPDLTDPGQYTPTAWETYRYDNNDNAGRTSPGISATWSSHWNTPSSDLLDPLGRVAEHTERTAATTLTVRNTYDIDGNLLHVSDPLDRTASMQVYDLQGHSWRQQLIDAGTTRVVLDAAGNTIESRDSKGALRLAAVDALRRPLRAWARERAADTPTLREAFVYGDNQAETGLQPADAASANLLGRPYHTYDEAGRAETTSYDLDGNLLEETRRVLATSVLMSAAPGPAGDWANAYYQADWQPAHGQTLAQHADPVLDTTAYTISTTYDALARPTLITAPLAVNGTRKTLHPSYSRAGTLTALTVDGDSYIRQILYNARGQRVLAILGCATMIRYIYDPHTFRLTRLRSEPTPGNPLGPTQDYGYAYDLVGNILSLQDRTPGSGISPTPDQLDRAFTHDPLYRLHSATGRECDIPPPRPWLDTPRCTDLTKVRAYTETYCYDDVGSLLTLAHQAGAGGFTRTFDVPAAGNQASAMSIGATTYRYAYDPCGNMLSETTSRLFEWNHANQLATFRHQTPHSEPTLYAQYRYDIAGQRVLKIVRKHGNRLAVTTYIGGVFERLTLTSAAGTSSHDELHILDGATRVATARIGLPPPGDASPAIAYHLGDHLGSSTVILDGTGAPFNREEYAPYGETSFGSYAKKRYRHTAKERDEESGLYYHGARYYAPWLGRWNSPDPAGLRDGFNQYCYVRGNPLKNSDPTGLQTTDAGTPPSPQVTGVSSGTPGAGSSVTNAAADAGSKMPSLPTAVSNTCDVNWEYVHEGGGAVGVERVAGESIPINPEKFTGALISDEPAGGVLATSRWEGELFKEPAEGWEAFKAWQRNDPYGSYKSYSDYASRNGAVGSALFSPYDFIGITGSSASLLTRAGTKATGITDAEALLAVRAERIGGSRVWIVGPEGASTTRAIRINGTRITYDTAAPAGASAMNKEMRVISNMLGGQKGIWYTGTHGNGLGEFGGDLLEGNFFRQERLAGAFRGFTVRDVSVIPRETVLGATTRPTVYSWCYSSSCFLP
jgi:RHS repeat-associated protein